MIKKILFCASFSLMIIQSAWADNNHQLEARVKEKLGTKVLTEKEVYAGADQTNLLYAHCIGETAAKLKTMYPDIKQQIVIQTVNEACEYPEDRYGIYSILLASTIAMKKPLSERQAAVYLEKEYEKIGRDQANAEQREAIYKKLGIMK
ncbi:hypothetical protein [Acinetobacter rudis]|uniref:Uncharacterized protein n=1 Tax=Acinetobacter rudis CIP 110305 TaxID=421052 RepID=S3MS43_9GAMM|nr:hypothetical protein [Acinetobacter rudis]EPF70437.1 hypothetical protein F945_03463 [Acinetobacter rudis CIP 110305]